MEITFFLFKDLIYQYLISFAGWYYLLLFYCIIILDSCNIRCKIVLDCLVINKMLSPWLFCLYSKWQWSKLRQGSKTTWGDSTKASSEKDQTMWCMWFFLRFCVSSLFTSCPSFSGDEDRHTIACCHHWCTKLWLNFFYV